MPDPNTKMTTDAERYAMACLEELERYQDAIKKETGYDMSSYPGNGFTSRAQLVRPETWDEYAAKVRELVVGGKRGSDLMFAIVELNKSYPKRV